MSSIYKQFTVKDASGKVVRFGTCTEDTFALQARNPGETVVAGHPPEEHTSGDLLGNSYHANRIRNYPPIGQQLDALYHAMDTGVIPKVPAFYDPLKAVKEQFPKE